jgi:hypothetical protein
MVGICLRFHFISMDAYTRISLCKLLQTDSVHLPEVNILLQMAYVFQTAFKSQY